MSSTNFREQLRKHLFKFVKYPYKYMDDLEALVSLNYSCNTCGETKNFLDMASKDKCVACSIRSEATNVERTQLLEFLDKLYRIGN